MTDKEDASLREFAGIIQEKAGPVGDGTRPEQPAATAPEQSTPSGPGRLQSTLGRQPRTVIAGIAAGAGVAIGYLLGKLGRR